MAQGDHSVQTKSYTLNTPAQQKLEKAGIDTRQFTECTGNLIQQDTHAKLVHAINALADTKPITAQSKLISKGTTDCAQAGVQLNKEGHVREAMHIADFCQAACDFSRGMYDGVCTGASVWWHRDETREHTLTAGSPSCHPAAEASAEFTYFILETAEIIARSAKGFATGSYEGAKKIAPLDTVQNLANITEHITSRTLEFIQNGARIEDCLLRGDREGAEHYYQANNAIVSSTGQALQHAADTLLIMADNAIAHAPHTPSEWEHASQAVGELTTKNLGEAYLAGQFFKGASKVAQGISNNIKNFDQIAREIALSGHFSGNPLPPSNILRPGHPIENVQTVIGSSHISGIPAVRPEFGSRVLINTGEQLIEGATQIVAEGTSAAASQAATILQLGKELGNALTEAKPGFIDITPIKPTCYKDTLLSELRQFSNEKLFFGEHTFLIDKKGLKHILTRHHPSFWEGESKRNQTFLSKKMTVSDIATTIKQVLYENRNILVERGTNSSYQIKSNINGINYVVGLKKGRIGQFYIEKD